MRTTLNKDKLAILTGAGANAYLGMPTLDVALDKLIQLENKLDEIDIIKEVRERTVKGNRRIQSSANVEVIIGKIKKYRETGEDIKDDEFLKKNLGTRGSKEENLIYICRTALDACYKMLLSGYGPKAITAGDPSQDRLNTIAQLYNNLSRLNSGNQIRVFTTNYDCVYQVMSRCVKSIEILSHINPEGRAFERDWYSKFPRQRKPKIYINRLHGCIAWYEDKLSAYNTHEKPYADGGGNLVVSDFELETMQIKLIPQASFPPCPAFAKAYDEFHECLCSVKFLLVWGYSFRDRETINLMNICSMINKNLTILFADPFRQEDVVDDTIDEIIRKMPGMRRASNFHPKRLPLEKLEDSKDFELLGKLVESEVKHA